MCYFRLWELSNIDFRPTRQQTTVPSNILKLKVLNAVIIVPIIHLPRILPSAKAMEVVTLPTRSEVAVLAWENISPPVILADSAYTRVLSSAVLPTELVMIAINLKSPPQPIQLLLSRAWIRRKASSDAAAGTNAHGAIGLGLNAWLVVVAAVAVLPRCTTFIAELGSAAAYVTINTVHARGRVRNP